MSPEGIEIMRTAKNKYLNAFTEAVRIALGVTAFNTVIDRISRLMLILPAAEVQTT